MRFSSTLIKNFIIPVLNVGISGFVGSWLFLQYQQPQVVYYTDGYYSKLKDFSFGSIFIVNEGRTPETNLSVSIGEKISKSDISIAYVSNHSSIVHENGHTYITLPKLKPNESAEIVFLSHSENETFNINNVTSDSGNIRHEEWTRPWWHFTKLQAGIVIFVISIAFFIGYFTNLWITQKKKRRS